MRGELTSSSTMWQLSLLVLHGLVVEQIAAKDVVVSLSLTRSVGFSTGLTTLLTGRKPNI